MSDRIIINLPLKPNDWAYAQLERRFNVAHHFYNACLGECLKRQRKYLSHPEYKKAIDLKYTQKRDPKDPEIKEAFDKAVIGSGFYLRNSAQFNKPHSLERRCAEIRNGSWIEPHLDSNTCLKLMERAWNAVDRARKSPKKLNKKTGRFEKPRARFKSFVRDPLLSIEAKSVNSSLKWDAKNHQCVWSGILIPALITDDPYTQYVINNPESVKFARLKRVNFKGKWRYSLQLCCLSSEIKVLPRGTGPVGLDIGPEKYAIVGQNFAKKDVFCKELEEIQSRISVLQRKCNLKQRKNNPDNFEPDAKVRNVNGKLILKKGKSKNRRACHPWVLSNREKQLRTMVAELHRKSAELRKCLHGRFCNEVRAHGDELFAEQLNYVAWQKVYGKSVGKRAPGMAISLLKQKFEMTGGKVFEVNPYKATLSQLCPNCGKKRKKKLSERIHICETCGYTLDRDLTSAGLAICVSKKTHIVDFEKGKEFFNNKDPILREASDLFIGNK